MGHSYQCGHGTALESEAQKRIKVDLFVKVVFRIKVRIRIESL